MILQAKQYGARLRPGHDRQQGFTLIELMIVVAIIGVLSVIAYSSYTWAVVKSRRKSAESCLQQGAQYMERYYATNLRYDKDITGTTANAGLGTLGCMTDNSLNLYYTIALSTGAALTTTTYTITAIPVATSVQGHKDTLCKTLSINQAGTETDSGTGSVSACW